LYHPHIVRVHDRGDFADQLWIAMDYVDGPDTARLLRERYLAGMPSAEVCDRRSLTPALKVRSGRAIFLA
jgi:serine/threonine-protein kinase